jgi:hypothetical protein
MEKSINNKSRYKILNRDIIKYLAIFFMFFGHLFAWVIRLKNPALADTPYTLMPLWMRIVTHFSIFCPPVMFFFVADGYKYTRDVKKYALRLLIFALITQIPHWLVSYPVDGWWTSNVIVTLFCGLLAIITWESKLKLWLRIFLIVLICGFSLLAFADWFIFGVLFILFLHIFRNKRKARFISYIVLTAVWLVLGLIGSNLSDLYLWLDKGLDLLMMLLAYLCMTVFYNGKKGKYPTFAKWFFYIFYPLHYLIIYAVYLIIK